jgi:hypothetical protein
MRDRAFILRPTGYKLANPQGRTDRWVGARYVRRFPGQREIRARPRRGR